MLVLKLQSSDTEFLVLEIDKNEHMGNRMQKNSWQNVVRTIWSKSKEKTKWLGVLILCAKEKNGIFELNKKAKKLQLELV